MLNPSPLDCTAAPSLVKAMAAQRSAPTEKEKYTYSASSFKIKTNEGRFMNRQYGVPLNFPIHYFTEELFELVQLSEVPVDKELFKVVSILTSILS